MSRRLAWLLGWRAFLAPGGSRLLLSSSFAMALGLVPLVVVLSIADGMIGAISARTLETTLYHVQAWSRGGEAPDRVKLALVPGFRGLWSEQRGFALAYAAQGTRLGLTLRGVDPQWLVQDSGVARYLKVDQGHLAFGTASEVWIGRAAAQKLGIHVGDELKLLTTRTKGTITLPRVTTVRVAAVVSVGYQELDRLWLFAPIDLTQELLDPSEDSVFYGIKGDFPLDQTDAFLTDVKQALGPGWHALSWQQTGRSQFLNYQATRTLLAVVMLLVLLVAAVNVSTAMVTTVGERRRETAILKALGGSDALVRHQFLVLGAAAGVLGTAVGLGLGVTLALGVNGLITAADAVINWLSGGGSSHLLDSGYYLETIPVQFDPVVLTSVAVGSILLAVVASWWPARRAARERPLEVLRRA